MNLGSYRVTIPSNKGGTEVLAPGSLDDLLPVRATLEIRYPNAHRYWDVSGGVVAQIEAKLPNLSCARLGPKGFEFEAKPKSGVGTCVFYWNRVSLDQDLAESPARFESIALDFWTTVATAFEISVLERVGNRYAYLFPTDGVKVAEDLLANRPIWSLPVALDAFGTPDARGIALRTVHADANRRIRVELQSGEYSVEGKSQTGALIDIDFSMTDTPNAATLVLGEFLRWNQRFIRSNLHTLLRVRE